MAAVPVFSLQSPAFLRAVSTGTRPHNAQLLNCKARALWLESFIYVAATALAPMRSSLVNRRRPLGPRLPSPASTGHVPIISHNSRHLHGTAVFDAQPCALITLKEAVWLAVLLLTRTLSTYDVLCSHGFGTSNAVGRPMRNLRCYLETLGSIID